MPLLSTAYFGPIHYYQVLINNVCAIETKEHFVKQSIRTRCSIHTSNGVLNLSVPVIKPFGSKTKIEDVLICDKQNWRKDHWKAIESSYSSAPYFDYFGLEIKDLLETKESNLIHFNDKIQRQILSFFDLEETNYSFTKEYSSEKRNDFRMNIPENIPTFPYIQVFFKEQRFVPNLSILDALFCEGPMARLWLKNQQNELIQE